MGSYAEVARERISWHPTVDYEKCTGCKACFEFCKNDVYDLTGNSPKPIVKNPLRCVVGCESCKKLCPNEAISFPSREELVQMLRAARSRQRLIEQN